MIMLNFRLQKSSTSTLLVTDVEKRTLRRALDDAEGNTL